MKAQEIRDYFRTRNILVTVKDSEELEKLIDMEHVRKFDIAPMLVEFAGGVWMQAEAAKDIAEPPIRRGKLLFIEAVPQKVGVLELINHLEKGTALDKEYALRLRHAGVEA
jgi:hypothetical protein